MLKIKKGEVITPYGHTAGSFTDESDLSQAILEHLQTRFPDQIEDSKKGKANNTSAVIDVVVTAEMLEVNPELVEEGVEEGEVVQIDVVEPEAFDVEVSTPEEPIVEIKSLEAAPAKKKETKKSKQQIK